MLMLHARLLLHSSYLLQDGRFTTILLFLYAQIGATVPFSRYHLLFVLVGSVSF